MNFIATLLLICGIFYAASFFIALIETVRKRDFNKNIFFAFCISGFFLHTLVIAAASYKTDVLIPLSNSFQLLVFIAWLIMLLDLILSGMLKMRILSFFATALCATLILSSLTCPKFDFQISHNSGILLGMHGVFAGLSYAFMALSAIFAIMQIIQIRSLQKKTHGTFCKLLPPLQLLEKLVYYFVCTACFSMFISVSLGIVAAFKMENFSFAILLKFIAGFLLFAFQIIFIIKKNKNNIRGKNLAWASLMLFALAMIMIIPLEYRTF